MKTALPQDISDFAAVATKRLNRLGGPQAAVRAETDDSIREAAHAALSEVGAFELDARSSSDDALAAAVLCQAAGATALPYPLVEEILAIDGARLALVNPEAPRIDHDDLPGDWIAADLDGNRYRPRLASRTNAKLGPFLVPASLSAPDGTVPADDVNLHLVLGSWRILGAMQQSLHIVTEHVHARIQFGKLLPTSRPSGSPLQTPPSRCANCRARQVHHLPAGRRRRRRCIRPTHSFCGTKPPTPHGKCCGPRISCSCPGFCDESDVSVLDRHTQPLIRLPLSAEALALRLIPDVRDGHLETLFSGAGAGVTTERKNRVGSGRQSAGGRDPVRDQTSAARWKNGATRRP